MHALPPDAVESAITGANFTAVQEMGDCCTSVGQFDSGQRCYERAASLEPDDPRPYIGLGVIALQQQQWDQADTAFRVACRLDPRSSRAYSGRAMVAEQRCLPQEAFNFYLKSLECDADNLTALLGLFQTSCRMGSFSQVIHYLKLYLENHAQDTSVMFSLAALYIKDGSLIKAKHMLLQLLALTPDNHDAVKLLEEVEHNLTREIATQTITPLPRRPATCTRIA